MIKGHGWIKEGVCGCEGTGRQWRYGELGTLPAQLLKDGVFACPIDNFGRFNHDSRLVIFAVALALHDAGIDYSGDKKQDIGLLGSNPDGALSSNLDYFKDYAAFGRKLGRGNLFVYTLPSSPLAEAAIHFGFQGPLLHMYNSDKPREYLLDQAEFMIKNKKATAFAAVDWDVNTAECHLVA